MAGANFSPNAPGQHSIVGIGELLPPIPNGYRKGFFSYIQFIFMLRKIGFERVSGLQGLSAADPGDQL